MSEQHNIVVQGNLPAPEISIIPEAMEARREALAAAEQCREITSAVDLDNAAAALTKVKALTRTTEDTRKAVKAPVLDVGRRIDAVAKKFLAPLEAEAARLSALVGTFQEAARLKAQREREEAARVQAEALAELQKKQAAAGGDEAAHKAAITEAAEKIAASQLAAVNAEGPRAEGITTRTAWKHEVTDINVLFNARPELCVIVPNHGALRAVIKASNGAAIPGVRIWSESAAVVRGAGSVEVSKYDY